ncbi:MAG TPA: SH3 domain-containing protein, partial [Anaerolineae bacterium]|nr:SH3 domain-containing protein [Anaerolineae bacterium]
MYRILGLLLIFSIVLVGCGGAASPTPTTAPPPTEVPTELPAPTEQPTETEPPATTAPTETPAPTNTPAPVTGVVKSTLNVRDQPTTRAKLLGVLKQNDTVTLVGRTDDQTWLQINYPIGETSTGWVIAERIDTTADIAALPSISAAASATTAPTSVAVQPTSSVPTTVTVTANTPAATTATQNPTAAGQTPSAGTPAATAVVTGTPSTQPTAAPPPSTGGTPPGSIIFDTYENGNFNIYRVRADGTGLQQLIAGGSEPALSPNGSMIAYRARKDVGGLGIRLASATGQDMGVLTEESPAGFPTWSPDGNNIAYHILPSGKLSGQIRRIGIGPNNTPTTIGIGVRPSWQPGNGTFVLFDGCQGASNCGSLLTENAFEGNPETPNLITFGTAGSWSPNGAQIAFQAPDDKGNIQIWTANADGSNRKQVTNDPGTHGMPIWSSDAQWLFYRSDQAGVGWAIFAIRTNGSDARKIIDSNVHPDQWIYAKLA